MVKREIFTMNYEENAKQEQQSCENKLSSTSFPLESSLPLSPNKQENLSKENSTDEEEDSIELQQNSSASSLNNNNNSTNYNSSSNFNNNNNTNTNNNNNIYTNHRRSPETTDEKLHFAKRLGYEEKLIYTALARLGNEAKENELLAELIKLSDVPKLVSNSNNTSPSLGIRTNDISCLGIGSPALRHIVIDGSNVALSHGNNEVFSCRGIKICVDYFRQRGHQEITAFVPNWRKESGRVNINNIKDKEILYELERDRVLVFTPSRLVDGKRVSCYDDRYILKLAAETDGIVVSNDNYRDLALESSEYHKVIKERILMYTFVNDLFMPPDDPLGRNGPSLDKFLKSNQQMCPYGKKCTYGNKCKYRHQTSLNLPYGHLPITVSVSAPLNKQNNSNREALSRTMSSTVEQQNIQSQTLLNQQYNLAQSSPMVANKTTNMGSTQYNTSPTSWQSQQQTSNNNNSTLDDLNTHFQFNLNLRLQNSEDVNINPHKKLQRQIPQRSMPNQREQQQKQQHSPTILTTNGYQQDCQRNTHRLLTPTGSAPLQCISNQGAQRNHQHLTRIPSAPVSADASPHIPSMQNYNFLSASDSHINDDYQPRSSYLPIQEQRRLLRFHLSSIFPQNQVDTVLKMYPNITDAKAICTALINLFPN